MESTVHDLYTWLKTEPELNFSGIENVNHYLFTIYLFYMFNLYIFYSANKKSIDTRTFTRSKKRSSRTTFESILESLSSPVSNTWKTSNFSNIEEDVSLFIFIYYTYSIYAQSISLNLSIFLFHM